MEYKSKTIKYPKSIHTTLLKKAAEKTGGNLTKYIEDILVEDSQKP